MRSTEIRFVFVPRVCDRTTIAHLIPNSRFSPFFCPRPPKFYFIITTSKQTYPPSSIFIRYATGFACSYLSSHHIMAESFDVNEPLTKRLSGLLKEYPPG